MRPSGTLPVTLTFNTGLKPGVSNQNVPLAHFLIFYNKIPVLLEAAVLLLKI